MVRAVADARGTVEAGTQCTRFTSTKLQILTQKFPLCMLWNVAMHLAVCVYACVCVCVCVCVCISLPDARGALEQAMQCFFSQHRGSWAL